MKKIEVKKRVLEANEAAAARLREEFSRTPTLVVNLISSPGSGKTSLLEASAKHLRGRLRVAALVGDIATERDADRLRDAELPARQILTGGGCHLDARQIAGALDEARFGELDILFIENVGNLVCPTSYDLGEDFKVALLSVVEGDDKPFKYPGIFSTAAVTVITKADLLPYTTFDVEAVDQQLGSLNPRGRILHVSTRTGEGVDTWVELLEERLEFKHSALDQ